MIPRETQLKYDSDLVNTGYNPYNDPTMVQDTQSVAQPQYRVPQINETQKRYNPYDELDQINTNFDIAGLPNTPIMESFKKKPPLIANPDIGQMRPTDFVKSLPGLTKKMNVNGAGSTPQVGNIDYALIKQICENTFREVVSDIVKETVKDVLSEVFKKESYDDNIKIIIGESIFNGKLTKKVDKTI